MPLAPFDLDDTHAVLRNPDDAISQDEWMPAREALRRQRLREVAAAYEAAFDPEAVEARRIEARAAAEALVARERARVAAEGEAARAAVRPFADGAAWWAWMDTQEERNGE